MGSYQRLIYESLGVKLSESVYIQKHERIDMEEKFKIVLSWSASNHEVKEYQAVVSDHCRIINPHSRMMPDLIAAAAEADGIIGA